MITASATPRTHAACLRPRRARGSLVGMSSRIRLTVASYDTHQKQRDDAATARYTQAVAPERNRASRTPSRLVHGLRTMRPPSTSHSVPERIPKTTTPARSLRPSRQEEEYRHDGGQRCIAHRRSQQAQRARVHRLRVEPAARQEETMTREREAIACRL